MVRSRLNQSRQRRRRSMATVEPIGGPRPVGSRAGRVTDRFGQTVVYEGEVPRHDVYTRVVHWSVAIFFILALLSGFAVFTPWLYSWLSPLFGSGARARLLHPWFGIAFVIVIVLQLRGWRNAMRWTENDRLW